MQSSPIKCQNQIKAIAKANICNVGTQGGKSQKKKKIPIDTIELYNNLIAVRTINTHAHSTSGILEF